MLTVRYEQLGLRAGDLLLDLGAGLGRHMFEAYRRGARVIALDRSSDDLRQAGAVVVAMEQDDCESHPSTASAGLSAGDALALPFADATFDRVISSEVFEHIPDDRGAAREVFRVLKPGGTAAITVPTYLPELVCWAIRSEYHAPLSVGGHVRIYRKGQLEGRLEGAGLVVTGSHHAHALHSPYWWLRCAVGLDRADAHPLVKRYHALLVKDMTEAPWYTRVPEKVLQPVLGKSLVIYVRKPGVS